MISMFDRRSPRPASKVGVWLNPNVIGLGVNRFLSDFGHEAGTAILPLFLTAIGRPPSRSAQLRGSPMLSRVLPSFSADGWAIESNAAGRGPLQATSLPA